MTDLKFDPERVRAPAGYEAPAPKRRTRRARDDDHRYLSGPVPLPWVLRAGRAPGRALHVGLMLWFLAGLARRRDDLKLSYTLLAEIGVDRHAAYRALAQLERAGLVTARHAPGRAPVVTLLDAPTPYTPDTPREGAP